MESKLNNPILIIAIVAIVAIAIATAIIPLGLYGEMLSVTGKVANLEAPSAAFADSGAKAKTWQVNGNHYNLNIIGAKNIGDVGDSSGHTLFVQLNGKTKIMMTQDLNGEFMVTDRNGLDGSASFNIAPGKYNIYARALGKPGGKSSIGAYGEFTDALDGSTLLLLGYVNIERTRGKSGVVNINQLFYVDVTLCSEVNVDTGECSKSIQYNDYWVFDIDEILNYWWEYDNQGLKLLQVRLYSCTLDPTATAPDYCRWDDGSAIVSTKTILTP